jgi:hypothetical protein
MYVITFVLKRMPRAPACHTGQGVIGLCLYDPVWALHWGETNDTHLRFKGTVGRTEWMEVFCDDERCSELRGEHMVWKMHRDCNAIQRYWATRFGRTHHSAVEYLTTGEDIIIIRPCMLGALRAVVMFRCLLARVRIKRRARIKTFIRGTHWAHKDCTLSRFSGTINTPVKQRICAYI